MSSIPSTQHSPLPPIPMTMAMVVAAGKVAAVVQVGVALVWVMTLALAPVIRPSRQEWSHCLSYHTLCLCDSNENQTQICRAA